MRKGGKVRVWQYCVGLTLAVWMVDSWAQPAATLRQQANELFREHPNQVDRAISLIQQARQKAIQQKQADLAANCCVDEATMHYNGHDDYRQASSVCRAGLQLTPFADSTHFKLWASLGEMYHQRGRSDSTTYCWAKADSLLTVRPALEREARSYVAAYWGNRGTAWLQAGDYPLAERCFQKRLLLINRRNPLRLAIAENQFATFYLMTNQLARADSLFTASLHHHTASDLTRGWYLLSHIDCRLKRQLPGQAVHLFGEAEMLARQAGADGNELTAYLEQSRGKFWELNGQLQQARNSFQQALSIGERLYLGKKNEVVWRCLMALSRLAYQQNQPNEALQFAQRAVVSSSVRFQDQRLTQNPAPTDFLNGPHLFEALIWKAQVIRWAKNVPNRLELARQTYEQAFALSVVLQESYSSDLTKLFLQEKVRPAFRDALSVAWLCYRQQPNPPNLAYFLRFQQKSNGGVLGELLQTIQNPYQKAPPELFEALQQAKIRLAAVKTNWVEQQQKIGKSAVNLSELVNAELNWSRAYEKLRPYALTHDLQHDQLTQLQRRLSPQMAFLHYSLTADSLLVTVIKQKAVRVVALPVTPAQLDPLVQNLRVEAARNPDPFQYTGQKAARTLFACLIAPVLTDLRQVRRLVIVRDGPLHYIPFEVLETGRRPADYVLRYMAVTYAYSVQSFADNPLRSPESDPSMLSMAPFTVDETTYKTLQQKGYSFLERSGDETSDLADTRPTAGNASKSTFLSLVSQHQLVHLATHAWMDDRNPGASYIAFFPDGNSHRLYAHEISALDLRHLLMAVLTGCHTGAGSLHQSEGLLSLSRAFATGGCLQVVTSIWDTHDGTTATITQRFYEYLRQGQPADVALQQAKLHFLTTQANGGEYGPPHFWAHLVLMGDHQVIYAKPNPWAPVIWIASCGMLLAGLGFGFVRWRQARF